MLDIRKLADNLIRTDGAIGILRIGILRNCIVVLCVFILCTAMIVQCYAANEDGTDGDGSSESEHSGYTITVVEDDSEATDLADPEVPLAATPVESAGWGIIDCILMLATCGMCGAIICKRHHRDNKLLLAASIVIAAVSVLVFILSSDFAAGIKPSGAHAVITGELFTAELACLLVSVRMKARSVK